MTKVLHLPVNVASHLSTTVRGLRAAGVDARGLVVLGVSRVQTHADVTVLADSPSRRSPRWALQMTRGLPALVAALRWAEVVHWYMTPALPGAVDVRLAARLGKPGVVEFSGSDIRIPELEAADNPYYAAVGPGYEYARYESAGRSLSLQRTYARYGFEPLVSCPSLTDYVAGGPFPAEPHLVRQRLLLSDYRPRFPDPQRARPLVVHASTAPVAKGTDAVLAAVESLRGRRDFEFRLLKGVPRAEALELVGRADVVLDQFVLGAHGSAAIEAMALGKPVVGWIKPSMVARYPHDLPIVNAPRDGIADALDALLADGARRRQLGEQGRAYVERHHDAVRLGETLAGIYGGLLRRRGRSGPTARG